ncbi:MAG: hypothetical protein ABH873_07425 [Candidatus Firestonebacteria bacterium]
MKNIFVLLMLFCFSFFIFATDTSAPATKKSTTTNTTKQTATAKQPATKPSKVSDVPVSKKVDKDVISYEYYCCPKCKKGDYVKPGKCSKCKVDLVKNARSYTYVCSKCGYSQDKEEKCPNCKDITLKKHEVLYKCIPCNFNSGEPGNCPKCLQPLKKIKIPIKK